LPRPKKDVESSLEKKGFILDEKGHHYFVYWTRDGRKTRARSKTSHTPKMKDIPDNILAQMARQCLLTKPEFLRLIDCPMERDEYKTRITNG